MPEPAPPELAAWLSTSVGPVEGPVTMRLLSGGRSNLTYLVSTPGRELVLRRPPPSSSGGHDVGREHRVLSALAPTPVRVPRVAGRCEDPAILGAPFYVMERVPGRVLATRAGAPDLARPARLAALAGAVVEGLAEVHAVDPDGVGLGGLGDAAGYVERQVRRWTRQWAERAPRAIPALSEIGRRLVRAFELGAVDAVPDRAYLVHGDYNLGNLLVAEPGDWDDGPILRAILDWEMSTLGHPLIDVALLAAYQGPLGRLIIEADDVVWEQEGWPDVAGIVDLYARATGRDVSGFDFFHVLAWFKMVVITEELRARHLAGLSRGEGHAELGRSAPVIAEAVLELASRSPIAGLNGRG